MEFLENNLTIIELIEEAEKEFVKNFKNIFWEYFRERLLVKSEAWDVIPISAEDKLNPFDNELDLILNICENIYKEISWNLSKLENIAFFEKKFNAVKEYRELIWKVMVYQKKDDILKIRSIIEKIPWPKKIKWKNTIKWKIIERLKKIEKDLNLFFKSWKISPINIQTELNELIKIIPTKYLNDNLKIVYLEEEKENYLKSRKKKKIEETKLETENNVSKILNKVWKIGQRVENIWNGEKKDYSSELEKILLNLNNISEDPDVNEEILEKINQIEEQILEIISKNNETKKENFSEKNTKENIENKEFAENIEKIDNYTNSKYEKFLNFLLSENWFHYSLSNSKNQKIKDSKWDGSFSMKIVRPILYKIDDLFRNWKLNPEKISWKIICEKFFEETDIKKEEISSFLNILKNFDLSWDFMEIFKRDFKNWVLGISKTNYYIKDNKQNLKITIDFIENLDYNSFWEK